MGILGLLCYTTDIIIRNHQYMWQPHSTRHASAVSSKATTHIQYSMGDSDNIPTPDSTSSSSSQLCRLIDSNTAFPYVWENTIKPQILNVSLMDESDWNHNLRIQPSFTQWVQESMRYWTLEKLQHTVLSPPLQRHRTIQHLHTILERKLQHRHDTSVPPLRILVLGGSVTTGHECLENIFDFRVRKDGQNNGRKASTDTQVKQCAWPGRLQDMCDAIFGPNIVEITNMATGGAQTEMSTTVLQFGLLPNRMVPDIIAWDHGINDAIVPVMTATTKTTTTTKTSDIVTDRIFQKLQAFYQATIHLTSDTCPHTTETTTTTTPPPVIILLDTLLGHIDKFPNMVDALTASAAVSKMTSWYPNIWGISYANTIRPYVLSHLVQKRESLPLLGMKGLYTHPGMMYHISMAWTMTYNIISALHNNCILQSIHDDETTIHDEMARTTTDSATATSPSVLVSRTRELDVGQIPELTDDLLLMDVPNQWNQRVSESTMTTSMNTETCHRAQLNTPPPHQHSSLRCYYAWIANRVLRIESPRDIYQVIKENLVENRGWTSFHDDIKTSPGWVAKKGRGSYFEMLFDPVPPTVESFTLIYMQSYSEKWFNSTLQIDGTLEEYDSDGDRNKDPNTTTPSQPPTTTTRTATNSTAYTSTTIRHLLSGYHPETTSILIPSQLPLPSVVPSSPSRRRRLRLQFQLVEGESFKIAGMAIC